ncbi:APH(3') family aminoglycoside O-phosphotransferase [Rhodococcus sp. MSC1_016]|uniref:APH(3') family aminoglycoside O-phosphotransferase n=1 Tax=Rhodococcus sp. MSC1_016 TaxID=2909266 RepID=UPI002329A64F|nr:aminoglycoside 3'-phosphotransferase [Rhodococcus wratislaviensis]
MHDKLRALYPRHFWTPITEGESGAGIYRLMPRGGDRHVLYMKTAPSKAVNPALNLDAEADRLEWLGAKGIPVARLVDRGYNDTTTWMVTEAVAGIPAAANWPDHRREAVVDALADLARTLHAQPADDCPFDRRLAVSIAEAEEAVSNALVNLDNLEDEYAGWSAEQLLCELHRTRPAVEEAVLCHGDFCPDNVLLDPETCQVTGLIDVGRLGLADRHVDLAIALRELSTDDAPWFQAHFARRFVHRYGQGDIDQERVAFYTLLDEFF